MLAIYKREVKSYLNSMTGCVMIVLLLAFIGFFVVKLNLTSGLPNLEYTLYFTVYYCAFIITVPFFTMRAIAEERHQRTEQLLLSLPIPVYKIVLAKYFSIMTVIAVPVAVSGLYPLIFSLFAESAGIVNYATAYNAVFLLLLLLSAMVAIGLYISSLFENQIIAAVLTAGIFLVLFFMTNIAAGVSGSAIASLLTFCVLALLFGFIVYLMTKNLTASALCAGLPVTGLLVIYFTDKDSLAGLVSDVLKNLAMFDKFVFPEYYGIFDITAIVYFLSIAGVFTFMTVQSVEKRRWN